MATNKELTAQVKALKDKLKEAQAFLKQREAETNSDLGDSPRLAIGLVKQDNKFKLARILYNPETNVSEIESIEDADKNPLSPDLAMMNAKKVLTLEIFAKAIKEK